MVSLEVIQSLCSGKISFAEPLAPITSFRIGGPADFYIEPKSQEELLQLATYLREQKFPFIIIGNGSNILVSDEGYRGAVINLEGGFSFIQKEGEIISAGAGIRVSAFVDFCIEHEMEGAEMLAGIPGTLGGAIIMNAGAYGGEISDHLVSVTVVREQGIQRIAKEDAAFRYRASGLQQDIILGADFRFHKGEKEKLQAQRKALLLKRNASQPTTFPNAGSIFKNPSGMFAAKVIEDAGLKGFRIGNAEVSERHANFIINLGNAASSDVVAVMQHVRDVVYEKFHITLEPEIRFVGFSTNILDEIKEHA